jgi:hypothetical protein
MALDTTLQVDGYTSGQNASFQAGFVAGEIGAVRLTPPGPFPMKLKEVLFLFGGLGPSALVLRITMTRRVCTPRHPVVLNAYLVDASNLDQSIDLSARTSSSLVRCASASKWSGGLLHRAGRRRRHP